jgi:hypothetical protein
MTKMQKEFLAIAACFLVCTLSVGLIDSALGAIPCVVVAAGWVAVNWKSATWTKWVPAGLFLIIGLIKLGWPS